MGLKLKARDGVDGGEWGVGWGVGRMLLEMELLSFFP
jgi:hypothetical protein